MYVSSLLLSSVDFKTTSPKKKMTNKFYNISAKHTYTYTHAITPSKTTKNLITYQISQTNLDNILNKTDQLTQSEYEKERSRKINLIHKWHLYKPIQDLKKYSWPCAIYVLWRKRQARNMPVCKNEIILLKKANLLVDLFSLKYLLFPLFRPLAKKKKFFYIHTHTYIYIYIYICVCVCVCVCECEWNLSAIERMGRKIDF